MTHTELCYELAGKPTIDDLQDVDAHCATCGSACTQAVNQKDINNPTFSQHGDFLKGEWVCPACAFMYRQGKAKPGNYLAVEHDKLHYLSISGVDKLSWREIVPMLLQKDPNTKVAGVLTTDVKPRLFPRTNLATIGDFGLYIHAPDYDVSEYREFDLSDLMANIELIEKILSHKFTKTSIMQGLFTYHKMAVKDPVLTADLERRIDRSNPAFIPALIIARGK